METASQLIKLFTAWPETHSSELNKILQQSWRHVLACLEAGRIDEPLLRLLRTLYRLDPSFPGAHLMLAEVCLQLSRIEEAVEHAGLQVEQTDAPSHFRDAAEQLLRRLGDGVNDG